MACGFKALTVFVSNVCLLRAPHPPRACPRATPRRVCPTAHTPQLLACFTPTRSAGTRERDTDAASSSTNAPPTTEVIRSSDGQEIDNIIYMRSTPPASSARGDESLVSLSRAHTQVFTPPRWLLSLPPVRVVPSPLALPTRMSRSLAAPVCDAATQAPGWWALSTRPIPVRAPEIRRSDLLLIWRLI
jgi:hypothetical protein